MDGGRLSGMWSRLRSAVCVARMEFPFGTPTVIPRVVDTLLSQGVVALMQWHEHPVSRMGKSEVATLITLLDKAKFILRHFL